MQQRHKNELNCTQTHDVITNKMIKLSFFKQHFTTAYWTYLVLKLNNVTQFYFYFSIIVQIWVNTRSHALHHWNTVFDHLIYGWFHTAELFYTSGVSFFQFFFPNTGGNEEPFHSTNTRQENSERKSTSEKGFLRTPPCWQVSLGSQVPKFIVPSIQHDVEISGPRWHGTMRAFAPHVWVA